MVCIQWSVRNLLLPWILKMLLLLLTGTLSGSLRWLHRLYDRHPVPLWCHLSLCCLTQSPCNSLQPLSPVQVLPVLLPVPLHSLLHRLLKYHLTLWQSLHCHLFPHLRSLLHFQDIRQLHLSSQIIRRSGCLLLSSYHCGSPGIHFPYHGSDAAFS